jgi:hypothetical protein
MTENPSTKRTPSENPMTGDPRSITAWILSDATLLERVANGPDKGYALSEAAKRGLL